MDQPDDVEPGVVPADDESVGRQVIREHLSSPDCWCFPEEIEIELIDLANEHGHYIYTDNDNNIEFDSDAMEHMDFLNEDWALQFIEKHKLSGEVIFNSLEGGQGYLDMWGYHFNNGAMVTMDKKTCLTYLASQTD